MDDDELLRVLTRLAKQDPTGDPRWRKLAEEPLPEGGGSAPVDPAASPRAPQEAREPSAPPPAAPPAVPPPAAPFDDETRARLADLLVAQLRDGRASAPPSSPARMMVDRKSGIRVRSPHEWDVDGDDPGDASDLPIGYDVDSLSGTSAPLDTDAPVCRSIGDESEPPGAVDPPRDTRPSASPDWLADRTSDRAQAAVVGGDDGPPCPELVQQRRSQPRARSRARTAAAMAGWAAAAALVSLLALRPAPFAPGAAPLPRYTIASSLGDGREQRAAPPTPDAAPLRVGRGARLTIALAPDARAPAPIDVKAFLVQGGVARPWPVTIHLDGSGGARVSGTREALFQDVAAGAWEAVFVIAEPGSPSIHAEALVDEGAVHPAGGRIVRQRLFLD
ncbi:hypothetical protein [Sorangium sp. So ce131]|uniref:hypothetical protein n=1 Tax=Sorangium sp. So ce131 TaxID=3133282 RepID=UPI003F61A215